MGEMDENLLKVIRHCQESLDKYTENRNENKLLHYLSKLYKLPIKVVHLEDTGVGRTVNGLRKLGGDVGDSAKSLVAKWKEMVVGEQEAEDEDDDEDEEDDDEDANESTDNQSDSDHKYKRFIESSSHRNRDSRDKDKKRDSHSSDSSKSHKKDKTSGKHNGQKSCKRRADSSGSDDEAPKMKHRKSEDIKQRNDSDSEEEQKRMKKHKSDKQKSDKSRAVEHNSKDRHKEHGGKHREKHKSGDKEEKKEKVKGDRKHKEKGKDKKDKKSNSSKSKSVNGGLSNYGIDSGSGASFAEALGMCEPSSSRGSPKKKSNEKKEKPANRTEETVPKLLKEPAVEPLDINLASLLPSITPNYRPLGNALTSDGQPKKFMSESEALVNIITSKNQRTKVYSGNKTGNGKVTSLFELCIRILQDNIDALEYTGGVPYTVLKPILEKANPNQLYTLEHHNPYLIEDTDELWQLHCQKEFRNKKREEMESWREMYLRCLDERDAKLKALTANIKQAQDKSLPVRMTKLAYVDAVAKPPRNIARKQAKNGTAFDVRKPCPTPSVKLNALATSGEAGKVAVPNPGSRAVERSSSSNIKPKKAPLMLKSISSFKNRFKR